LSQQKAETRFEWQKTGRSLFGRLSSGKHFGLAMSRKGSGRKRLYISNEKKNKPVNTAIYSE